MPAKEEPRLAIPPEDPELESTDGGWDPYVTSLLLGAAHDGASAASEGDDPPVMTFSRTEGKRPR